MKTRDRESIFFRFYRLDFFILSSIHRDLCVVGIARSKIFQNLLE